MVQIVSGKKAQKVEEKVKGGQKRAENVRLAIKKVFRVEKLKPGNAKRNKRAGKQKKI